MKHKHCELIKAWADGAEIQVNAGCGWEDCLVPQWKPHAEYRIKPEEKKPVVRWLWAARVKNGAPVTACMYSEEEAKTKSITETHIKLEWSRTEFDE